MSVSTVVFWIAIALMISVALVLCMTVVGSWVAVLEDPPNWLKKLAIQKGHAKPVAVSITKQATLLVAAVGAVIYSAYQQRTLQENYSKLAASLLCQVVAGNTPESIMLQIGALQTMGGSFDATLAAYHAYFTKPGATINELENMLPPPRKRTAYDWRVLGLAHIDAGESGTGCSDIERRNRIAHYDAAAAAHREAIRLIGEPPYSESLPGHPSSEFAIKFVTAVKVDNVLIDVDRAELETCVANGKMTPEAKQLLESAVSRLDELKRTLGQDPVILIDLADVYAVLQRFADVDRIFKDVTNRALGLSEQARLQFFQYAEKLDANDELKAYAEQAIKGGHLTWTQYLDAMKQK